MQNFLPTALFAVLFVALSGCGGDQGNESSEEAGVPRVYAVNYPLAFFAERIGGDAVEVAFPVPADGDPAFWRPSDEEVGAFQEADLILRNGAGYAKWVETASLPKGNQLDTSQAFSDRLITVEPGISHSHGKEGDHDHGGVAFTTWIDLKQAVLQAEAVRDGIKQLVEDPNIDANFEALKVGLEELDAKLEAIAKQIGDRPLVASHPVYQYFARRYGLNVKSVLWEPETVPDAEAMADLKRLLADHEAKWMVWEGEPDPASVAKLKALGIGSLVFAPCGNRPERGDFLSVMEENLAVLESAFSK